MYQAAQPGPHQGLQEVIIGDLRMGQFFLHPTPEEIDYDWQYRIIVQECIPKQKTQCTQPYALMKLTIIVTLLTQVQVDTLFRMRDWAGPYWVITQHWQGRAYLQDVKVKELAGRDPYEDYVVITTIEAND